MNSLLDKNRTWEVELAKLLTVKNVTVQINEAVDQHQHYKIHTIGKYQSLFSLTYVSNIAQLWFARKVERRILDCSEYLYKCKHKIASDWKLAEKTGQMASNQSLSDQILSNRKTPVITKGEKTSKSFNFARKIRNM